MLQSKTVLSLTVDLLANNAFNHLKDEDISALHHLIVKLQEPLTAVQQNVPVRQAGLLLGFWSHACTADLPAALLHRCNTLLYQLGRNPLEEAMMEVAMY